MALIPKTTYAGQTVGSDPNYPEGKAQNVTVAGDGTGTPLEKDWVNDLWGFLQAMLDRAGITPSGLPDQVGASQYLDSISQWIGTLKNLTPEGFEISLAVPIAGNVFDASTQITSLTAIGASNDGLKLYAVDAIGDDVQEYTLSTAFDASSATPTNVLSVATEETSPSSFFLRPNGALFFIAGNATNRIQRYDMPTPFSLSGASFSADFFDYSAQATDVGSITFSPDGSRFYIGDNGNEAIHEYAPAAPWLLVGSAFVATLDISAQSSGALGPKGMGWNADGSRLIVAVAGAGSTLYEYAASVPFSLASAGFTGKSLIVTDVLSGSPNLDGLAFSDDGQKMFVGDVGEVITGLATGYMRIA